MARSVGSTDGSDELTESQLSQLSLHAQSRHLLVVAIDFGTTYSGYAFSFLNDFQKDPIDKISTNQWNSGSTISQKTPTILFFDPKEKSKENRVLFGYDAENRYLQVAQDKDKTVLRRCYYFSLFKMELYGHKTISENMQIKDIAGHKMKAVEVFRMSLEWLKDHLFKLLQTRGQDVKPEEIQWVITVPAIWNDAAKHFMRIAGKKAGLPEGQLSIALEPEAASVYCQHIPVDKHVFPDGVVLSELDKDAKFMVADLGGGTADITVHQKLSNHRLRELLSASGDNHGGSAVNKAYLHFLADLVGDPAMAELKQNYMEDYLDILRDFEITKKTAGVKDQDKVTLKVSAKLDELCKRQNNKSMKELATERYGDNVKSVSDKLRVKFDFFFKTFFEPTIKGILRLLNHNLSCREANSVNMIILVGGFAASSLVHNAIHDAMADRNIKVIVPDDPELAVLKGAVIFGHSPRSIESRITKYTYGISSAPVFDPRHHKHGNLVEIDGRFHCKDVFSAFMYKGTSLDIDHKITKRTATVYPFQPNMKLEIFESTSLNPTYTTDAECIHVGDFVVDIANLTQEPQQVEVDYIFGDTCLKVVAHVQGGRPRSATFNLPEQ